MRGCLVVPVLALAAGTGCGRGDESAGELHKQKALIQREVEGLRASVAKLDGGQRLFPDDAVLVSIAERVIKEFVDAQLPFDVELESYRIQLKAATARFHGSPTVNLTGTIVHKDHPDFVGEVSALGALESIELAKETGTLRARLAVSHVDLLQMGGLEKFLSGSTVDELARRVRLQLADRLPVIQIPVKIEQSVDLPAVTEGPVRLHGASMPLAVSVAEVAAGQGVLWIAIRVVPGELVPAP
jgi:hypothetical protein